MSGLFGKLEIVYLIPRLVNEKSLWSETCDICEHYISPLVGAAQCVGAAG
jgi:hypothetical protein